MGEVEAIQRDLLRPLRETTWRFKLVVGVLAAIVAVGAYAYWTQLNQGLQVTAMRDRTSWGIYIANFVFWIGISHVGALMSAILRLAGAEWRRPVTRMAEVITVCSLFIGAAMPLIDLGRPDRLLNVLTFGRLQSAILWDFLSIFTYFVGSLTFLFLFLLPDLGLLRDSGIGGKWRRKLYRVLAVNWRGTPSQKHRLEKGIHVMTILILPIAISVHTVVSWIFAMTLRVGWNSTIFGPYFVAGALFSGVAAVLLAMAIFSRAYNLGKYITARHFRNLSLILLVLDLVYIYFTLNEYLTISYKPVTVEQQLVLSLYTGPYATMFWVIQVGGLVIPAFLLAIPRLRTTTGIVVASSLIIVTMWLKRYLIVVSTMGVPLMPDAWGAYFPSGVEIAITAAGFAGFALLFALFSKLFPIVSVWEVTEEVERPPTAPSPVAANGGGA